MFSNPTGSAIQPEVNRYPVSTWKFGTSPESMSAGRS